MTDPAPSHESVVHRRVAIVTGSESGIGRAAAVALAVRGFDVGVTWCRDREAAEETAREVNHHGRHAAVARLDLVQTEDIETAIAELAGSLGGLHVFVN